MILSVFEAPTLNHEGGGGCRASSRFFNSSLDSTACTPRKRGPFVVVKSVAKMMVIACERQGLSMRRDEATALMANLCFAKREYPPEYVFLLSISLFSPAPFWLLTIWVQACVSMHIVFMVRYTLHRAFLVLHMAGKEVLSITRPTFGPAAADFPADGIYF